MSIDEISRTREMFGLGNVQALGETSVDSSDLYQYLGSTAADSDMISSVAVQKREKGYGVRVKIRHHKTLPKSQMQFTPMLQFQLVCMIVRLWLLLCVQLLVSQL